ncbi:MAG: hypothetical protein QM534_12195 [Sediminibacterium sp.]|nr:hypothetical protein [Sediminibacterium sp.]
MKNRILLAALLLQVFVIVNAQEVPGREENVAYIVTFGAQSLPSWGDDDFSQTFFFLIPKNYPKPVYINVYDPEAGGKLDEMNGKWDTRIKYSVYGGKEAFSNKEARGVAPVKNYRSGTLLASKTFDQDPDYDEKWYSFGPFNPGDGEYVEELGGYVFKIVCDGISGNDGNLYKYFLSIKANENIPVEGGNAFTYEYSFRLKDQAKSLAHLYPFLDKDVVSIKVNTFDFDNDGNIKLYSNAKNGHYVAISNDNEWVESQHLIQDVERNKSIDIQLFKFSGTNNDMVMYVTNQYNVPLPFFAIPLGGVPKYKYKINISVKSDAK